MIAISLYEKFCCQNFITSIKVIDMTGYSSKTNKLRNINTIGCEEHHHLVMENSQYQNQSKSRKEKSSETDNPVS